MNSNRKSVRLSASADRKQVLYLFPLCILFLSACSRELVAVAGEELGFVGSAVIIILLLFITIECIFIARKAKDTAGRLICCGVGALIGFQTFVNIGVASGLLPNTGVTLPFVSYGLTSLWSLYIGIGLVLNVGLQPKKY